MIQTMLRIQLEQLGPLECVRTKHFKSCEDTTELAVGLVHVQSHYV